LTGNKFVEGIHGKFVPGKTGSPLPVDVIEGDHLVEVRRKERGRTTDSEGRKGGDRRPKEEGGEVKRKDGDGAQGRKKKAE
jgi:hypothetical protein